MKETKFSNVYTDAIYKTYDEADTEPKMFLTTKEIKKKGDIFYKGLLTDLKGNKILKFGSKVEHKGDVTLETRPQLTECFEKGFVILTYYSIFRKNINTRLMVAMNVYDYSGNKLYYEKIEYNEEALHSAEPLKFKAHIDDKFVDQKVAEFEAKKGGEGK